MRALKEFTIQYLDENGNPCVAYIRAHNKEEAVKRFKEGEGK